MWSFSLLSAMQTVEKSMGFVVHRLLLFLGFAVGFLLATLAGAGTAIGVSSLTENPTLFGNFGALAGFAAWGWVYYKFRPFIYRSIRAPHLMLLARLVRQDGAVPEGKAQLSFARSVLDQALPNANLAWEIRNQARQVLPCLAASLGGSDSPLASDFVATLRGKGLAWLSASNADLLIPDCAAKTDLWHRVRSGIVLQAHNAPLLIKNRGYIVAFQALGWLLAFAILLLAFNKVTAPLPFDAGFWTPVFALIVTWSIHAIFFEPIGEASMMQLQLNAPGADDADQLAAALALQSDAFRRIVALSAG